nr:hypothetical protein [Thermoanaerobaculia bacterium]
MTHADRPSGAGRRTTGGPLSFPLVLSLLGTLASCATVLPGAGSSDAARPGSSSRRAPAVASLSLRQKAAQVVMVASRGVYRAEDDPEYL